MSDQLQAARLARAEPTWPVKRLRYVARLIGGGTPSKGDEALWSGGTVPWASPKDMKSRIITETADYITEDAVDGSATSYVEAGSPLMVVRSGILRHTLPVAIAGRRLTLNQDMKAFRLSKEVDSNFFVWWMEGQSADLLLEWRQFGATVESIDTRRMMDGRLALPPLDTQKSIAAFLDRETARVDELIAKKQRQVALLDQRARQAVTEIVIGHNDQAAPSVETGLDYMPRIPAHWMIRRAGHLFQQVAEPNTDDLPVLSVSIHTGISDRQLGDEERDRKVNLIEDRSSYKRVRPGYLAYNMMRAWQGAVGVSTVDGAVSPAYVVAKPVRDLHSPYYQFLLRTPPFIEQMRQGSKGITDFRLRLYWEQFRLIMLPVPPLDEQKRIAKEAEHEISYAAQVAARVSLSVERLKERRAALITAAVTGELDIRQTAVVTTTKADRLKFRVIVGAEIIHRHQENPKFGRVKLQKELYLAEAHLGISELQGNYLREAAGPLDRALIDETEKALETRGFYRARQPDGIGGAVSYIPLPKAGQHVVDLTAFLGPRIEALRNLINLLSDLDRRQVEAVATLYAVWNDALMDGKKPDDDAIISGVLTEWHSEKGDKFSDDDLRLWLSWMKRQSLVPRGQGPRTAHTMTRDMFS